MDYDENEIMNNNLKYLTNTLEVSLRTSLWVTCLMHVQILYIMHKTQCINPENPYIYEENHLLQIKTDLQHLLIAHIIIGPRRQIVTEKVQPNVDWNGDKI